LDKTSGTYSHSNGVTEQTVFTLSPTDETIVWGIWLDMVNLTQAATIRVKYAIDGTTLRTFQNANWNAADDDGVLIGGIYAIDDDLRVTLESGVAEGASRDIPYSMYSLTTTANLADTRATYSLSSSVAEQTMLTFTPSNSEYNVHYGAWLDLSNLTQNMTIRIKHRIDGTNYRTFETINWSAGDDDGILLTGEYASEQPIQVSLQSEVLEGASRDVPYQIFYYPQITGNHILEVDRTASSVRRYVANGTLDPLDFKLRASGEAIDLSTISSIEFWTIDKKGAQRQYTSGSGNVTTIDADDGVVRVTPTATSFRDFLGPYRGYFWVFDTATNKYAVPENGYINVIVQKSDS